MQIESLSVVLRRRSNPEAIDLGFALGRRWFIRLWISWMIAAFPVFCIAMILDLAFVEYLPFPIGIFLFWWLKPLYEQPLLFILSRQLFSENISLKYIVRNYFKIVKPQLHALLLWRRLSLSRSFNNPVAMLEGLKGKARRTRLDVLHSKSSNSVQWLTIICVHLEFLLNTAFLVFLFILVPSELLEGFELTDLLDDDNLLVNTLNNIGYLLAASIIAPFYVSAGFSLYIARRTDLESWDIELAFKNIANRINSKIGNTMKQAPVACMVLFVSILFSTLPPLHAESTNYVVSTESSRQTIEEILTREDFGKVEMKKQWVYVGLEDDDDTPDWLKKFFEWLLGGLFDGDGSVDFKIFEILIWLGVIILVTWLVYKYAHWVKWINLNPIVKSKAKRSIPQKIMGLDIRKESLPADILGEFTTLLYQDRIREALSLLYRASLFTTIQHGDIEIPPSATERECNQIISKKRSNAEAKYFGALTHAWVLLAYGNQLPNSEVLELLANGWSSHYGKSA